MLLCSSKYPHKYSTMLINFSFIVLELLRAITTMERRTKTIAKGGNLVTNTLHFVGGGGQELKLAWHWLGGKSELTKCIDLEARYCG